MNGEWLTPKQVLDNRAWRIFARHPDEVPAEIAEDPKLLKEYNDFMSSEGYDRSMAIFKASSYDIPTMRCCVLDRTDYRSYAYGDDGLDIGSARLVGVAPEVQSASQNLDLSDRVVSGFSPEQIGRLLREEVGYTDSKTRELLERLETYQ